MSSPLSSLKKGSRNPNTPGHIPGQRPIPFRHPEYSEDESKLLEEITTSMAASRIRARSPFGQRLSRMDPSPNPSLKFKAPENNNADDGHSSDSDTGLPPPTDRELMKLMMSRLTIMEQKVQTQEKELKAKDRHIKILEEKLHIMMKARGENNSNGNMENKVEDSNSSHLHVQELEDHCLLLQQQIHEMETFLSDYGMVWVGEQGLDIFTDDQNSDAQKVQKSEEAGMELDNLQNVKGMPFKIDFDRLFQNIQDLNVIAGEGEARIQHTVGGGRLKLKETVPITFYANGIFMFEGPFRPYTDPSTLQCVQDFLDGYFPSELQMRYPEGVPFSVKDMHTAYFKPQKSTDVFSGTGLTLGGEEQPSRLLTISPTQNEVDKAEHATSSATTDAANTTSEPPVQPVTIEQFLRRLPKSVIKDGKVIDIRNSVGNSLTGESSATAEAKPQAIVIETAVTKAIKKTLSETKGDRPKTPRDTTTLRIKSEDGNHTYVVKMRFNETIGDLRQYLNNYRVGDKKDYEICSTYPRNVYSDDKATVSACGLVPNGVLYLKANKKIDLPNHLPDPNLA